MQYLINFQFYLSEFLSIFSLIMSSIMFKLRFEEEGMSIGMAEVIKTLSKSYLPTIFALDSSFYLSSLSFKIVG